MDLTFELTYMRSHPEDRMESRLLVAVDGLVARLYTRDCRLKTMDHDVVDSILSWTFVLNLDSHIVKTTKNYLHEASSIG